MNAVFLKNYGDRCDDQARKIQNSENKSSGQQFLKYKAERKPET